MHLVGKRRRETDYQGRNFIVDIRRATQLEWDWPPRIQILIADPDERLLADYREFLANDFDVATAVSGLECLAQLREAAPDVLSCERVLTAMFIPALELARDRERGGQNFLRLLGRAYADPAPFIRRFLSEQYAVMIARFKAAFGRALPELPKKELSWRLHFVMGALSYTLAGTDALKLIAALSPREAGNDEMLLHRLAPFLVAGLKAPLPDLSEFDGGSVPVQQAGGR